MARTHGTSSGPTRSPTASSNGSRANPSSSKGGISPSGVPHLGNVNEIMRGFVVAEVLRERGHEVRQVFTTDDRDPLRKLPRKLADLDGNVVDLGEVNAGALGKNLGHPYTDIPDPGCCDSYGDHFSKLIEDSATLLGVDIDVVSTTELYESGEFEDLTRYVLEHQDEARAVLSEYQDKIDEEYVPFNPICSECGKITETVTAVDLDAETVEYECTDMEAGDQTIQGCGHEGTATFREGKLPWRFEWPAGWDVLGVDFEPFGKDHAEGSWPSGVDVAENVFDIQPPVPMVYEWFTRRPALLLLLGGTRRAGPRPPADTRTRGAAVLLHEGPEQGQGLQRRATGPDRRRLRPHRGHLLRRGIGLRARGSARRPDVPALDPSHRRRRVRRRPCRRRGRRP